MDYSIIPFENGMEKEIARLVKKVYDEFVAQDYSKEGNDFFYDFVKPENFVSRVEQNQNRILCAVHSSVIVGLIEIRDQNQISLLFVDSNCQKKGIAKKLYAQTLKLLKEENPHIKTVHVHASPFSIPAYKKLGFNADGEIQEHIGIKYLPMTAHL